MSDESTAQQEVPGAERTIPTAKPTTPAAAGLIGAAGLPTPGPREPNAVQTLADDFMSPESALGTFKEPQSTMIAGIEEHVGYVPGWLLILFILAVVLAMICWLPQYY